METFHRALQPDVLTLFVFNCLIVLAYLLVALAQWRFVWKRYHDMPGVISLSTFLFGMLFLSVTISRLNFLSRLITGTPRIAIETWLSGSTALFGLLVTVITWGWLLPAALKLRSPKTLEQLNERLQESEQETKLQLAHTKDAYTELDKFTYTISHDLRSPLGVVENFAHMLQIRADEKLDPDEKKLLYRIIGNTRQAIKLVEDILAFSKIERKGLEWQPVALRSLLLSVLEQCIESAPNGKNIAYVYPPDNPIVLADETLLRQVLTNLIANAIKFTSGTSGPTICFFINNDEKETMIRIRDNGIGFDVTQVDKLFRAFERLNPTASFMGNGIGLATVRRIVARHGGRVWATNLEPQGAEFGFSLPKIPTEPTTTSILP